MADMEYIKLDVNEHIATITLARPPANALSRGVLSELDHAFTEIEQNDNVHVVLLCGEGRFFAAGADIKEFTEVEDGATFTKLALQGQKLFDRIESFKKPVIAAIHGAALGGGLELAMACHIRLATEDAKLGLPELQLGLIPGFAGSQRLPRYVGRAKAAEMLLTSEPITGLEAKYLGLVNSTHSEQALMGDAQTLAKKIAKKSTFTTRLTLELLQYSIDEKYEDGAKREAELFGLAFDSADGKEGIEAFIEKRAPKFQNK